jgi:hypothetical protein
MKDLDFDVFISHASEDKAAFVMPLANELKKYGLRVWFDKFALKVGDSLHDSIEQGLARSRFGVVVLSRKFLSKKWPREELNGLFARNVEGRKVILPIWHKVNAAQIRKTLPMIADKVALRSSDGPEAVARALVEAIRPELLGLDVRRVSAFEANESFIAEAQRKYPGYKFEVQSGGVTGTTLPDPRFTAAKSMHRVEISVSDPSKVTSPPGGKVQFYGEGVKKVIEFQRTGKPQKWEPGEFAIKEWTLPLMPQNTDGSKLAFGERRLPNTSPRHIRIEVGSQSPLVFPIMEMRPVRHGTDESEFVLSDRESPLKINIVFPVGTSGVSDGKREIDLSLSWEGMAGKRASECKKVIEAIDALRSGSPIQLIDIRLDQRIFEKTIGAPETADPFEADFRRTVLMASQIEEQFSVPLRIPEIISEEDAESLFHLDCLLNQIEYATVEKETISIVKAEGEVGTAQANFIKGEWTATFADAPLNYPGYFPLFSQRIATPDWVRVVDLSPSDASSALKTFSEASTGSELNIEIEAKGAVYLRWKEDSALRNIEVGKLKQKQP